MGSDVSIKPVGLPTASPFLSSGDAKRNDVPTQLPAPQVVSPPVSTAAVRRSRDAAAVPVTNKITIDKDAAAIVFQTVDDRTSEIIGQYPAEGMLRRRAYIRALDQARSDIKTTPTDRKA